jgi:MFS family permease
MNQSATISPWRVLVPVGLGTGLSLIGDSSLYTVLPTHAAEAGVTVASVGILLSANRFIRLALNGPAGLAYDRWPRRYLFVAALFIGAVSTAMYAFTQGFWPLLAGRLLWGLAWAGIWVGGNSIILDICQPHNRGRWIGVYQIAFYMGASGGAILGGLLTDWWGYYQAMAAGTGLTLAGAVVALFLLPETKPVRAFLPEAPAAETGQRASPNAEFGSAVALLGVNRLVIAGILMSTFGLLLAERLGNSVTVAGYTVGVASLTGLGLGLTALISMAAAPLMGGLSDRASSRWQVAAGGLTPGVMGFGLLSLGSPAAIVVGLPLTAIASGCNQGLSTAIVGDFTREHRRGFNLGLLFTTGDLASAIGPLLAYALIPFLGLNRIYLLSSAMFLAMLLLAWRRHTLQRN